ncbi:MAG: hypothetical protein PVI01_01885 [Gemmatimonadales bacterium]|jgi:hypothetical protein
MSEKSPARSPSRPLATPIILVIIAATHFAYGPLIELRDMPMLLPALVVSLLLGLAYAHAAWRARGGVGFREAVNLIVGEDVGVLAAGLLLGYPWSEYFRPGTVIIITAQIAFAFAEIVSRQEAGVRIVPASRLAWFVLAYALAYSAYIFLKPAGILGAGTL